METEGPRLTGTAGGWGAALNCEIGGTAANAGACGTAGASEGFGPCCL
jgi:hypothetical protein